MTDTLTRIDLSTEDCVNYLTEAGKNRLARAFNSRKARQGLPPVQVSDLTLLGHFDLVWEYAKPSRNWSTEDLQEYHRSLQEDDWRSFVRASLLTLTHEMLDGFPPSSVRVQTPKALLVRYREQHRVLCQAAVEQEKELLRAHSRRTEEGQVRSADAAAARAATQEENDKEQLPRRLAGLRRLGRKGGDCLARLARGLEASGLPAADKEALLGELQSALEDAKEWEACLDEARFELQRAVTNPMHRFFPPRRQK